MLAILLLSAAMAGQAPLDSLSEWVGTWTAQRQSLTLTVDDTGHFRMDLDHKGERCFLEGTLLVRDGMARFGSPEERLAHEEEAADERQVLDDLEDAAVAAERRILDEVGHKPKLEKRYAKEGYTFVDVYGGSLEVDLPPDAPESVALEKAAEVVRHCSRGDDAHPHHWPVLGTTPRMFFPAADRVVALFPDHNGKDRYYRLVKGGAEPAMEAEGSLGGAWVVRLGAMHMDAELWGEMLGGEERLELAWEDGCTETARIKKTSMGYTFDAHGGSCDRLGTFRRVISERGGIVRLRENEQGGELTLLREDGL